MSAWIVSKGHIDCLVQSLATHGIIEFADADKVGQELWRECHKSVNHRYDERTRTPSYKFDGVEAPLDVDEVYTQARCYAYQSCEHPGWSTSKSCKLIEELSTKLLDEGAHTDLRGTWGITHITEAIAKVKS